MRSVVVYVLKEYRDQRATIVGLFVMLFATALILSLATDTIPSAGFVAWFTLFALAASAVVFASSLSEQGSKTLALVRRLPNGLHRAFWGKVLFLLSTMSTVTLAGLAISTGMCLVFAEDPTNPIADYAHVSIFVTCAISGALWTLAANWWLPKSNIGIFAAALTIALLGLPSYMMLGDKGDLFATLPWTVIFVGSIVLGLGAAWVSFVRGRRAGGCPWSSAWRGLCLAAIGGAVLTGASGRVLSEWYTLDPRQGLLLHNGYLGENGRYAYLNVQQKHQWPSVSLVVDLREGTWRQVGEVHSVFRRGGEFGEYWSAASTPSVALVTQEARRWDLFDANTAEVLCRSMIFDYGDHIDLGRATERATSPIRLPDGRRGWFFRRRFEMETEDGGVIEVLWEKWSPILVRGFGILASVVDRRGGLFDLTRSRFYPVPRRWRYNCWVLRNSWLVGEPNHDRRTPGGGKNWRLFDPDTEVDRPAPGVQDGDRVIAVRDDGTVIVAGAETVDHSRGLYQVDTADGDRRPMTIAGVSREQLARMKRLSEGAGWSVGPVRTPDGRRLFRFGVRSTACQITTLAAGSLEFSRPIPGGMFVGCDDDSVILIADERTRLLRVGIRSGEREVLFPREPREAGK